jgi:hypothetical protein
VALLLRSAEASDRYARDASVAALAMAALTPEARLTVKNKIDALFNVPEQPAATVKRPGGLFA